MDKGPKLADTTLSDGENLSLVTSPVPGAPGLVRTLNPPEKAEATVPKPVLHLTSHVWAIPADSVLVRDRPIASLRARDSPRAPAPLVPYPQPMGSSHLCEILMSQALPSKFTYSSLTFRETIAFLRGRPLKVIEVLGLRVLRTLRLVVTPLSIATPAPVDPILSGFWYLSRIWKNPVMWHGEKPALVRTVCRHTLPLTDPWVGLRIFPTILRPTLKNHKRLDRSTFLRRNGSKLLDAHPR